MNTPGPPWKELVPALSTPLKVPTTKVFPFASTTAFLGDMDDEVSSGVMLLIHSNQGT
jgi:hypothetical protein